MIKVELLCFGIVAELLEFSTNYIELPEGSTVKTTKNKLLSEFPKLQSFPNFSIAINEQYAQDEDLIHNGDQVALIPPVAGG